MWHLPRHVGLAENWVDLVSDETRRLTFSTSRRHHRLHLSATGGLRPVANTLAFGLLCAVLLHLETTVCWHPTCLGIVTKQAIQSCLSEHIVGHSNRQLGCEILKCHMRPHKCVHTPLAPSLTVCQVLHFPLWGKWKRLWRVSTF